MHRARLILAAAATLAAVAVVWMLWAMQQDPPKRDTPRRKVAKTAPTPAPPVDEVADEAPEARPQPEPVVAPAVPKTRTLVGTVTNTTDNTPIPGVTVRLVVEGKPHKTTLTNAAGEYTLKGVPGRPDVLEFSATGYESETFEEPSFPKDPRVRWDVEMVPAPGLYGRVVVQGPAGTLTPVSDAWVGVRRGGTLSATLDRMRRWRSEAATRTDFSGRFALDIDTETNETGLWSLEARHAQYGRVREVIEGAKEVTLVLPGGGYISGRVVDPEGDPVAEFSVSTSGLVYGVGGPKAQSFEAGTGAFRLGPLSEGKHTLWAVASGFQPGEVKGIEVKVNEETSGVVITLKPSMTLSGRITDFKTGRPVEGALVRPAEWQSRTLAESVSAYSDENGNYRLPSLPGPRTSIVVQAEGYREVLAGGVAGQPGDQLRRDFAMSPIEDEESPGSELTGIGAVLMRTREGIYIRELVDGGPAAELLNEGDVIVQVNDMDARSGDLTTIVQAIRGEVGTDVDLWVKREGAEEPERVTLTRARVVMSR
ncbi:MAG: carboxypeptidase regulatory-like domain-containing protein [Bradymonadia bacterium]